MLTNVHPADELAAIREEIKILESREAQLRALLLNAPEAERDGNQYKAVIIASTRESVDKNALIAAIGRPAIEPYLRKVEVKTLKVIEKANNENV